MIPIEINRELAEIHWNEIENCLKTRIKHILKVKTIKKWKQNAVLTVKLQYYLNRLLKKHNLKKLILTAPDEINGIIEFFESFLPNSINRADTKSINHDYLILYSIFVDYGYKKICNLTFINRIGIESCPYCNRSYIHTINNSGKIKPEIDHFYPKGIYPFLGVCYFNLVPSCQTCNGFGGKGSEDTYKKNVTNPYLIKHNDFNFSYDIVSLSLLNPINSKGSIKVTLPEKLDENAKLFKLEELYEKHEDHVLELIYKSQIQYSEKYREHLINYPGLNFSNSEIDRMIIGNYAELDELHKRPLSKLYRDIAIELGLIS